MASKPWRADPKGPRTAEEWNAACPVGTQAYYYPVARSVQVERARTRSGAWTLGNGEAVVSIDGRAGGVSIRHLLVLPPNPATYPNCPSCGEGVESTCMGFVSGVDANKARCACGWHGRVYEIDGTARHLWPPDDSPHGPGRQPPCR